MRASGYGLTLLPGTGLDAISTAAHVTSALADGDEDAAYRFVIQRADDLAALHAAERVAASVAPPAPTGDARFDAFIAGIVETRLEAEATPPPSPPLGTPQRRKPGAHRRIANNAVGGTKPIAPPDLLALLVGAARIADPDLVEPNPL